MKKRGSFNETPCTSQSPTAWKSHPMSTLKISLKLREQNSLICQCNNYYHQILQIFANINGKKFAVHLILKDQDR